MTDWELLREYAKHASQAAFAEVVRRHVDWVHSVAMRRVGDPHLAEDVTQAAFLALAQNAGRLREGTVVSAWLFGVVKYASISAVRREKRRQVHEKEAAMLRSMSEPSAAWERIAPVLDEAVGSLKKQEQEAVLLRFYQRKSFAEVAAALGSTEEAVRKRVVRALEKLRGLLRRRGVDVSGEALGAVMLTEAAREAGRRVAEAAMAAGTNAQAAVIWEGARAMMVVAKVKAAAVAVGLVLVVAGAPVAVYRAVAASAETRPAAAVEVAKATTLPAEENAATLYRQAFDLLPKRGLDAELLTDWDTIQPEMALDMLMRLEPANNLARRAAGLSRVDWGWADGRAGVEQALKDLNSARALGQLVALRARYQMAQRAELAAVEDWVAVFMLARHMGSGPMLISRLAATGTEAMAINQTAQHLPALSPEALKELVESLDALPPMPGLGVAVQGEKKLAEESLQGTAQMSKELAAFYDELGRVMDLPPGEFERAWIKVQERGKEAGVFAELLLPSVRRARQQEERMMAMRAMLKAAVAYQAEGEEAFKRIADPFGKGPFIYRKVEGGFVLESKLLVNGKPVNLVVQPQTTPTGH